MRTATIYGPLDIRVEEVEIPRIGPADALVRVKTSGICGSDVHRYLGTEYGTRHFAYPMNSGHEYCGEVAAVGSDVQRFRPGDKVTLGAAWTRGHLGAFGEFIDIPDADQGLHKLPPDLPAADAALLEPLTVALKGWQRPAPSPEDQVLLLGAGPVGLCVLALCGALGVGQVLVSEPSPIRRALAERMGAATLDPLAEDLAQRVMDWTGGRGVDVTFECAGAQATLQGALALTRREGRISLVAHYRRAPSFDIEALVMRSMIVYGPVGTGSYADEAVALVRAGKVHLAPFVSHTFPLEQAREAFEVAADANRSVKVLFVMP